MRLGKYCVAPKTSKGRSFIGVQVVHPQNHHAQNIDSPAASYSRCRTSFALACNYHFSWILRYQPTERFRVCRDEPQRISFAARLGLLFNRLQNYYPTGTAQISSESKTFVQKLHTICWCNQGRCFCDRKTYWGRRMHSFFPERNSYHKCPLQHNARIVLCKQQKHTATTIEESVSATEVLK